MIRAVENVEEPFASEQVERLEPARIEVNNAGVRMDVEHAFRLSGLQEAQANVYAQAQPGQAGMDREVGLVRLNRIFEEHVEHALLPGQLRALFEPGASGDVGERLLPEQAKTPAVEHAGEELGWPDNHAAGALQHGLHEHGRDEILQMVDLMMRRTATQLESQGLGIELTQAAKDLLAEIGYDPRTGTTVVVLTNSDVAGPRTNPAAAVFRALTEVLDRPTPDPV